MENNYHTSLVDQYHTAIADHYNRLMNDNNITIDMVYHEIGLCTANGIDLGKSDGLMGMQCPVCLEYAKLSRAGSKFALNRKQRFVIAQLAARLVRCESERREIRK